MTIPPASTGGGVPARPVTASTADALRASLNELIAESQALRADVQKAEALRAVKIAQIRRENLINLVLIGGLSLLMLILLAVAYQSNKIAHDTKRNADQIIDCTTEGGKCYKAGRAATGGAVTTLQRIQVYIVECSRALPVDKYPPGPAFDTRFENCVRARLASGAPAPTPLPRPVPSPSPSSGD